MSSDLQNYEGKVYHEKKIHQTHFQVKNKKKLKGKSIGRWVKIKTGRWVFVWSK